MMSGHIATSGISTHCTMPLNCLSKNSLRRYNFSSIGLSFFHHFTERMFNKIPLTFHFPALYFQLSVEHIFCTGKPACLPPSYHPSLSGHPGGRRNGLPPRLAIRPTSEYVGHTLYADRRAGRAAMGRLSRTRLCMGYRPEAAAVGQERFSFRASL